MEALSPAKQIELVEALQDELDHPDSTIEAAWSVEARDRLAAYRQGRIRGYYGTSDDSPVTAVARDIKRLVREKS